MAAQPPYIRIAAEIQRRIEAGELRAGQRVPSTRQIAMRWGVAVATATKALAELRRQGIVTAVPGSATVVSQSVTRRSTVYDVPTRDRIVRIAIGIADTEGLAALTMRRVASDLEVATMSLYRHVNDKEGLIALMADAAFGGKPPSGSHRQWRPRLEHYATTLWELYHAHPWLPRVMNLSRPVLAPNGMRYIDGMLRALDGHGLDDNTRLHIAISLFGYVRGMAMDLEVERDAIRDTGINDEEWLDAQEDAIGGLLAGDELSAFAAARTQPGVDISVQSLFEHGLARLLDGVGAQIAAARGGESVGMEKPAG